MRLGLGAVCVLGVICVQRAWSQVWDVDRLIRARNPGASFTTTERPNTTWGTLRSITYNPLLEDGATGKSSVEEESLVRRVNPFPDQESSSPLPPSLSILLSILCILLLQH